MCGIGVVVHFEPVAGVPVPFDIVAGHAGHGDVADWRGGRVAFAWCVWLLADTRWGWDWHNGRGGGSGSRYRG